MMNIREVMLSVAWNEEVGEKLVWLLLVYVVFAPETKALAEGTREDKVNIAPVAPIKFKKSRREIFLSELKLLSSDEFIGT